jgi:hypothetical protein
VGVTKSGIGDSSGSWEGVLVADGIGLVRPGDGEAAIGITPSGEGEATTVGEEISIEPPEPKVPVSGLSPEKNEPQNV